ncbi:MAG: YdhR family protein [Chloroflexota bacterium]
MITEVVTFKLPQGMTRDQLVANFRQTAPKWHENPDLIRKNYLFDGENGLGGGVYLWKSKEDALRWHNDAFRQKVLEVYGSKAQISYYETPIVVDNAAGKITDEG